MDSTVAWWRTRAHTPPRRGRARPASRLHRAVGRDGHQGHGPRRKCRPLLDPRFRRGLARGLPGLPATRCHGRSRLRPRAVAGRLDRRQLRPTEHLPHGCVWKRRVAVAESRAPLRRSGPGRNVVGAGGELHSCRRRGGHPERHAAVPRLDDHEPQPRRRAAAVLLGRRHPEGQRARVPALPDQPEPRRTPDHPRPAALEQREGIARGRPVTAVRPGGPGRFAAQHQHPAGAGRRHHGGQVAHNRAVLPAARPDLPSRRPDLRLRQPTGRQRRRLSGEPDHGGERADG